MKENNLALPIAIVVAGIIISGTIFYTQQSTTNNNPATIGEIPAQQEIKPVSTDDHILGNPNAELTIIEYSDTECPFCKRFHETMNMVMDEYGKEGKVKWVYRHFPLDSLHQKARAEAEATECAEELGGNDKFWEYINHLYEITPSNDGLDLAELPNIAEYVGLDKTEFESCLFSGKYAEKVENQLKEGLSAGIQGTPYSAIITKSGKKVMIEGAYPYYENGPGILNSFPPEKREAFCINEKDASTGETIEACGVKVAIDKLLKD